MGFFKSKKGSIISDYFCIEEDLGQFKKGDAVDVALYEDHLELQKGVGNKDVATLAYSQITDVFYGSDVQVLVKDKSPIAPGCRWRPAVRKYRCCGRRYQRRRQEGKEGQENSLHHQLCVCGWAGIFSDVPGYEAV